MEKPGRENGTLLLTLIAGFSINGSFAALFSSVVPFSVFPIIALLQAVNCLHQCYLNRAMLDDTPKLAAACFLLGLLLYSAIMRVEHRQEIGANFLPSILCVALVFWIGFKLKARKALNENAQE